MSIGERVLVTGASGLLGRQAVSALCHAGFEVFATARTAPPEEPRGTRWFVGDLLDSNDQERILETARPTTILHLAWTTGHGAFWTDPANVDWALATVAFAKRASNAGAQRFVGVGTCFEYAWPRQSACHEANTPLANHTAYDTAKDCCQRLLTLQTKSAGMAFSWARMFYTYGADEPSGKLVRSIARALARGEVAPCGSGRAVRDYIDARDAGAALAALAVSPVCGPVNIASGRGVQIATIARLIGTLAGRPDQIGIGLLPDRAGEPPRIVADVTRLRDEVGFRPTHTLRAGLAEVVVREFEAAGAPLPAAALQHSRSRD